MSYPLVLQPLVIEDDERTKDAYKQIFETIASDYGELPFCPAPPLFAFSYEEAKKRLAGSKIFHIIILDLRLPEKPKMPAIEGVELGINLLDACVDRDRYPIPALLVISAHIGSTEQARLQQKLQDGFWYGRQFVKGDYSLLQNEIRSGCIEALRYCSVGIHIRDGRDQQYPTITPREEDLLRRSVLLQHEAVGLDLEWWSATRQNVLGSSVADNPWTKVLMGRYILDSDHGASRPRFFKLLGGTDGQLVIESARHLEHKLTHIKLSSVTSRYAALLVTEKVGSRDERPKSLEEFFRLGPTEQASKVARQIAEQVHQLGDISPDSKPLNKILWPAHDAEVLAEQWQRLCGPEIQKQLGSNVDPVVLYSELVSSGEIQRIHERSIVHGDLQITNLALDFDAKDADAYIFDPGVVRRNVAGRDLAVLEVSVLLHQPISYETLTQVCAVLYRSSDALGRENLGALADPIAKAIAEFIRALREAAGAWNDPEVYALLVLDSALIQLGGLALGSSGNKIGDQRSAAYLLAVVSEWFTRFRPPHKMPGRI